jgi:hypothetical protein
MFSYRWIPLPVPYPAPPHKLVRKVLGHWRQVGEARRTESGKRATCSFSSTATRRSEGANHSTSRTKRFRARAAVLPPEEGDMLLCAVFPDSG